MQTHDACDLAVQLRHQNRVGFTVGHVLDPWAKLSRRLSITQLGEQPTQRVRVGSPGGTDSNDSCADNDAGHRRRLARHAQKALLRRSIVDPAGWAGEALNTPVRVAGVPVSVLWIPVPSRGDHGGGALVSALWPVLPRRGGPAGRTRSRGRSRAGLTTLHHARRLDDATAPGRRYGAGASEHVGGGKATCLAGCAALRDQVRLRRGWHLRIARRDPLPAPRPWSRRPR